jgi:hypothetical protein
MARVAIGPDGGELRLLNVHTPNVGFAEDVRNNE